MLIGIQTLTIRITMFNAILIINVLLSLILVEVIIITLRRKG